MFSLNQDNLNEAARFANFTSSNEVILAPTTLIYPNPTNGSLHIRSVSEQVNIRILDLLGNEVDSFEHQIGTTLNVDHLIGHFLFVIEDEHHIHQQKISITP